LDSLIERNASSLKISLDSKKYLLEDSMSRSKSEHNNRLADFDISVQTLIQEFENKFAELGLAIQLSGN
jgi:hypothetical protein